MRIATFIGTDISSITQNVNEYLSRLPKHTLTTILQSQSSAANNEKLFTTYTFTIIVAD